MKINLLSSQIPNTLTALPTSVNFSNQLCPDNFVAEITYDQKTKIWQFSKNFIYTSTLGRTKVDYSKLYNKDVIIVILESPHKDEFDSSGTPIGPAIGDTGNFFENEFINILNSNSPFLLPLLDIRKTYDLVFINAVQFQTSQGVSMTTNKANKTNRDLNWLYFWNQGFESDLINRINCFNSEKFILNLCTKGYNDLQSYVSNALISNSLKFHLGQHPSTWNIQSNQYIR